MNKLLAAAALALALATAAFSPAYDLTPRDTTAAAVLVSDETGHGSGVHIGNGNVITAAHVAEKIGGVLKIKFAGNRRTYRAEVIAIDKEHDVAVLQMEYTSGPSANLACRQPRIGERIHVVGNPFDLKFVHTFGYVASVVQSLGPWLDAFVGDVTIGPGNSGGPAFDTRGDVIGIVDGAMAVSRSPLGWAFIVPSSTICRLMGRA